MLKQRIKIPNEYGHMQTIGYMIADCPTTNLNNQNPYEDFITIGISVCHKSDIFDREKGELLAYQRLQTPLKEIKVKEQYCKAGDYKLNFSHKVIQPQLEYFIKRCARYFKDKNIILPKIVFT